MQLAQRPGEEVGELLVQATEGLVGGPEKQEEEMWE